MLKIKFSQKIPQDLIDFLEKIKRTLPQVLGKKLLGIYVHGSLSYGTWGENRSDVDLAIIVKNSLTKIELNKVRVWYKNKELFSSRWHYRTEADFVCLKDIKNLESINIKILRLAGGKLCVNKIMHGFPLELNNLRNEGIKLFGSETKIVFPAVSIDSLSQAVFENFKNLTKTAFEWVTIDIWNQQYVISQFCRMLYAVENNYQTISKKAATKWAIKYTPAKFKKMLQLAYDNSEDFTGPKQPVIEKMLPEFVKYVENKLLLK